MNKIIGVEVQQLQGLDYSQIYFMRADGSYREYKVTGLEWGHSFCRLIQVLKGLNNSELEIHSNGIGVTYYAN